MTIEVATILGVWLFASATALSKEVTGRFLLLAFIVALSITVFILM